ncbi:VOC family protein [Saccharopolyspora gloriosae]|uniref:Catechol 2,3-dioxygenase-like lactoylglutathione lyase family enzyme n=1 Tax=Saccharopolyspora gloriosae TaxID=455344 RepID=A0A840NEA7_9PSEU|nr:VOC family protein [Saccharopolyspora gloriosae]MBB5068623.1 catechol 2,3-dioxygenase-like lactoylglutathione lyase family enzyme [Saccharopolyspora gloriosae]
MIQLNHTIVMAHDQDRTARFFTEVLGLPEAGRFGPFRTVRPDNDVTLDVLESGGDIAPQHYAFLVGEQEFDAIFDRIVERDIAYWADPHHGEPGVVNTRDGGRGIYFDDPNGHNLEILTREYGSGPDRRG